jgi:spore coat protein U-like protein
MIVSPPDVWQEMQKRVFLIGIIGLLASIFPVQALTVSSQSFMVNATIAPGCQVSMGATGTLGSLNFGTYSGVMSGQVSTQFVSDASLSLACTPDVSLEMKIDGGLYYTSVRNMQHSGGTDKVPYHLYTKNSLGGESEIGVNQNLSVNYSNSDNIVLSIYGTAQLTGSSPMGNYSDQLTVTLSW